MAWRPALTLRLLAGGGQLGRMLAQDATRMGLDIAFLDPEPDSPAKQVVRHGRHRLGDFRDREQVAALADDVDVLTVEIEHVDVDALAEVEATLRSSGGRTGKGVAVRPASAVVRVIQDKYLQHVRMDEAGVRVAEFAAVDTAADIARHAEAFGLPLMLKARKLAYDGRGNHVVRSVEDVPAAIDTLGGLTRELYVERMVDFVCEVAVMVVRAPDGTTRSYPAVETVHRDNICHLVYAPLRTSAFAAAAARAMAERAVQALGDGAVGVFGVEMFLLDDGAWRVATRRCSAGRAGRFPGAQ